MTCSRSPEAMAFNAFLAFNNGIGQVSPLASSTWMLGSSVMPAL